MCILCGGASRKSPSILRSPITGWWCGKIDCIKGTEPGKLWMDRSIVQRGQGYRTNMWTVRPAEFRKGNAPNEKAARGRTRSSETQHHKRSCRKKLCQRPLHILYNIAIPSPNGGRDYIVSRSDISNLRRKYIELCAAKHIDRMLRLYRSYRRIRSLYAGDQWSPLHSLKKSIL